MMKQMVVFVVLAMVVAWSSQAAVTQGGPFSVAGTGVLSENASATWVNNSVGGSNHVQVVTGSEVMVYQEMWDLPTTISSFIFDGGERAFGGDIYVATHPGGPCDTLVTSFSAPVDWSTALVNVSTRTVYGVRVEFNQAVALGKDHQQLAHLSIFSSPLGDNLALGMPTIQSNPDVIYRDGGSVTDSNLGSEWRATGSADVNWIGFEVPDGGTIDIDYIRVTMACMHGTQWAWHDFDVQLKRNGKWEDAVIRVNVPASESICWISLGEVMTVEGIRLYGSVEGGNNPVVNGSGLIVDDIMAFNTVAAGIPEPATMSLLALGGLALLRRRT